MSHVKKLRKWKQNNPPLPFELWLRLFKCVICWERKHNLKCLFVIVFRAQILLLERQCSLLEVTWEWGRGWLRDQGLSLDLSLHGCETSWYSEYVQLHVTRTTYSSSAKYSLFFVMEQPRSRQTRPSVVAPSFSSVFRACSFCPLACHFMTARYSPTSGFTSVFQTWRRGTAKSKKWTPEPYKELFQELSW